MRTAFTLVELLVVVTILVVLLALLAPALDKAIYQAELAVCGARLKALGVAVNLYVTDQRRSYPLRKWVEAKIPERPKMLAYMADTSVSKPDDRPVLRQYFSLDETLNCPLNVPVSFDPPDTQANTNPYSSYSLWFGFRYLDQKGLRRMGDRLEYLGDRYSILAGDWDGVFMNERSDIAAHPDYDGQMMQQTFRNHSFVTSQATLSIWQSPGGSRRGLVDVNHGFTDGSVERFDGVRKLSVTLGTDGDDRMVNLPARLNGAAADNWRVEIPAK